MDDEIRWQLDRLTPEARVALAQLPPLGEDTAGPLGPGLLARGVLGPAIRRLQAGIDSPASGDDRQHLV